MNTTCRVATSYYGNLRKLRAQHPELTPVAISVGVPRWFGGGRRYPALAPTRAMLRMPPEEYDHLFDEILAKLDPQEVLDQLGDGAVMLCWEPPGCKCHRRRVAEWLEASLGINVPELGIDREKTPAYLDSPLKK